MSIDLESVPSGREILAVEDSPTQAEELKYILERRGYAVTVARNGRDALARLNGYQPGLVISDINMPEMDGYELCRRLKAHELTRSIPVILVTALTEMEDIFQGMACGADSFISKPYSSESLLDHVHHMLTARPAQSARQAGVEVEIALSGQPRLTSADPQRM